VLYYCCEPPGKQQDYSWRSPYVLLGSLCHLNLMPANISICAICVSHNDFEHALRKSSRVIITPVCCFAYIQSWACLVLISMHIRHGNSNNLQQVLRQTRRVKSCSTSLAYSND
jgi:hypothetical protein